MPDGMFCKNYYKILSSKILFNNTVFMHFLNQKPKHSNKILLRKILFLIFTRKMKNIRKKLLCKEQPFDLAGWIERKKKWKTPRYLCPMLREKKIKT